MVHDDVRGASTLTEMMRRRAALSPDQQYFQLFDEMMYLRLTEQQSGNRNQRRTVIRQPL